MRKNIDPLLTKTLQLLGDFVPPTGAPPLDPAGGLRPPDPLPADPPQISKRGCAYVHDILVFPYQTLR